MFNKPKLTHYLLIIYSFFCLFLLFIGGYCLFMIRDYTETIDTVEREQLSLSRSVAEMSRHQLDQVLRFNEILLYARVDDREKFEVSNEKYGQAGKRMGDEILEGRNIAQRGIDRAKSEAKLKDLDAIKTLLKGIEKAHGDYEHLGSLLIRGVYQYDFLLKKEYTRSGNHIAGEEEAAKHIAFLNTTLSAMEDEVRRLENGIKESMERVKRLSKTLTTDAEQRKDHAFNRVLSALFFALSAGLLLIFITHTVQKDREQSQRQVFGQALAVLADLLAQFQDLFGILDPTSQQMEKSFILQRDAFGSVVANFQELARLSDSGTQLFTQLHFLISEKHVILEEVEFLVKQLNKDTSGMLDVGAETGRIVLNLKELMAQISMLSTNASAEAFRSDATRSFAVFTEEIRDLVRVAVVLAETIGHRAHDTMKGVHTDRLHIGQTHQKFGEVVELARKEKDLFEQMVATTQRQPFLYHAVQNTTTEVLAALQANEEMLVRVQTVGNAVRSRADSARHTLGQLEGGELPKS